MSKSVLKIVCFLLLVSFSWTGFSAVGPTSAFFSDAGDSSDNTFTAASLDFSLDTPGDFSPLVLTPGQSSTRDISITNNGSLGFQYKINYEKVSGNLCDDLELTTGTYSGLLKDFTDQGAFAFSGIPSWNFVVSLPSGVSDDLQGEVCDFNFVFNAWQENIANYGDGGFTDIEEIDNTIKAGYWNPPVVLNEFLPNAGDYPEFIELYNKTGSPVDLTGFYIMAETNRIDINSANTSTYSGGSTTIDPGGWLVITAAGDNLLDDTSGTVTLYNQNDVEVDSYIYDASDYNINNTPGGTNNLAAYWPFDNDSVQDISGNNNNGTNNGATSTTGKINQGLSFDGVDDYVEVSDATSLDITNEITVEAWVQANTWANNSASYNVRNIIDKAEHETGTGYGLYSFDGLLHFRINKNSEADVSGTLPSLGAWNHVVGTYDGSTVRLYVNGVQVGEKNYSGVILTNNKPLYIGAGVARQYWFSGLIDEVKIYNRALSTDEISRHYDDVGFSGAVPQDKSYARIPDGSDNWVDPFPTPGGPNILESEIINQEEPIQEEPIVKELTTEELPAEETPVVEEESVSEEEPVIEEELTVEGGETPADETPADETPADEAPADETPADEEELTDEETIIVDEPAVEPEPEPEPEPELEPEPEPVIEPEPEPEPTPEPANEGIDL